MIEIRNLSITFNARTANERRAINGLDLSIARGSFITVIGSNGAGKSTLLNALAGDVAASAGQIRIDGEDVAAMSLTQRAAHCARVFQDPLVGTCGPLTIEENLALADDRGQRRGLIPALDRRRRARYRDQLALLGLGLENRLGERMERLSGGQRQAVSLLMATLQPSRLLLLDEMTAALDPGMAARIMELTRELVAERKLTTLMVTHSMEQALTHGNRILMMHQGSILTDLADEARDGLKVADLIALFTQARGTALDQDNLLL